MTLISKKPGRGPLLLAALIGVGIGFQLPQSGADEKPAALPARDADKPADPAHPGKVVVTGTVSIPTANPSPGPN